MHYAGILTFVKKLKVCFFHSRMNEIRSDVAERQKSEPTLMQTRMRCRNKLCINNLIAEIKNIKIHRTRNITFMRRAAVTTKLLLYQ